jgi:uncharacterized protein YbjQ (UPF0145 family)
MNPTWVLLLQFGLPLALVVLGYGVGRVIERRHYASLRQREGELQGVVALSTRWVPEGVAATDGQLLTASVVVSADYFKAFVAGFRSLFGGRFRGYETLLERARREALLRLKLQAQAMGAPLVIGVRLHTTQVTGVSTPAVEVMAYGTALRVDAASGR